MEAKGRLIHCNGMGKCEGLNSNYIIQYIEEEQFCDRFLNDFNLNYILESAMYHGFHFHIATHPKKTDKCEEKAEVTGLPLERVIKGNLFEDFKREVTYVLATPGIKHSLDMRLKVADSLGISREEVNNENKINRIRRAREDFLPMGIEFGTVHPFMNRDCFIPEGKLEYIFFDINYLEKRGKEDGIDDFSITTHPTTGNHNHLISMQMNYKHAFTILKNEFGEERVKAIDLI